MHVPRQVRDPRFSSTLSYPATKADELEHSRPSRSSLRLPLHAGGGARRLHAALLTNSDRFYPVRLTVQQIFIYDPLYGPLAGIRVRDKALGM